MNEFNRELSPDEIETLNYVGFYRFWSWEYTRRNPEFFEMQKLFLGTQTHFRELGFPPFMTDGDAFVDHELFSEQVTIKSKKKVALEYERFNILYSSYLTARHRFGFKISGPRSNRTYSASEMLSAIENDEPLSRPNEPRERSEVIRFVAECEVENGIKSLDYEGFPIFGYDALVAIDFDRPISEIQAQIRNTKKELEMYKEIRKDENGLDLEFNMLEIEKIGIQKNSKIPTQIGTDNPRAIGLWLWDYIHSDESPNFGATQIEAINSLKEHYDVAKLGYAATEESVFRKWYRNTVKCIDAAEVLHMR
nr:hypothetical protein [uncultured Pseudodesulfovibrio sp.]